MEMIVNPFDDANHYHSHEVRDDGLLHCVYREYHTCPFCPLHSVHQKSRLTPTDRILFAPHDDDFQQVRLLLCETQQVDLTHYLDHRIQDSSSAPFETHPTLLNNQVLKALETINGSAVEALYKDEDGVTRIRFAGSAKHWSAKELTGCIRTLINTTLSESQ